MSSGDAGAAAASLSGPQSIALASGVFPSLADNGGTTLPLPELAQDIEATYRCCSCGEVLRQPRQTPCGHRICTPCLEELTKKFGSEPFHCPANEEECEDMRVDQVGLIMMFYLRQGCIILSGGRRRLTSHTKWSPHEVKKKTAAL